MARSLSAVLLTAALCSCAAAHGASPQLTGGYYPAWSPDGTQIAFANGRQLVVMSSADGRGKRIVNVRGGGLNDSIRSAAVGEVKWATTRRIIFSQNTWLESVDRTTARATPLSKSAETFAISTDGRTVAFVRGHSNPTLGLVSVAGGRARLLPKPAGAHENSPEFSPDAKQLAFVRSTDGGSPGFSLFVAPLSGGTVRAFGGDHDDYPRWSPDGSWIAFRHFDIAARLTELRIVPAGGGTSRVLYRPASLGESPVAFSWSRDSTRLAYGTRGGQLGLIDLNGHRDAFDLGSVYYTAFAPEEGPHWSPDGTKIAFAGYAGRLYRRRSGIYVVRSDGRGLRRLA